MNQSLGIETLLKKIAELEFDRYNMLVKYNNQIAEMESCIELLSGKPYSKTITDFKFDDESPNYIKNSQEEV